MCSRVTDVPSCGSSRVSYTLCVSNHLRPRLQECFHVNESVAANSRSIEFNQIGLGQWFRYFTGATEAIAGILLLVPATRNDCLCKCMFYQGCIDDLANVLGSF